jgi:hypothetical protein
VNKPQSLRLALNKAVACPGQTGQAALFVDNGSVVATGRRRCPWEYRYTLNVVVGFQRRSGIADGSQLAWLMENQPDAIHNPELREKLFTFEVDILRNDICDISLNLQLTERVIVSADGDVSSVEAVPEPRTDCVGGAPWLSCRS